MYIDPIIEELREVRRTLAAEAGNDLHEIAKKARALESSNPERFKTPQRVTPRKNDKPTPPTEGG
jgi:hypothetical protein